MNLEAVFLDRDGTLIREEHYLNDPEKVSILPGVIDALTVLKNLGIPLFVITNQSGIGRSYISIDQYEAVHRRFIKVLNRSGIIIQDTFYCPYHPEKGIGKYRQDSEDRKPKPGMILKACSKYQINPQNTVMIGDKSADVFAGQRAGGKGVLVLTGYGEESRKELSGFLVDYIGEDLLDIVNNYIISL